MINNSCHFNCPYCGTTNEIFNPDRHGLVIHYCSHKKGGCDKPFAVEIPLQADVKLRAFPLAQFPEDSEEQP